MKQNILKIYNQYLKHNFCSPNIVRIIEEDCTIFFKSENVYYLLYLEYNISEAVHQSLNKVYSMINKISLFPKFKYSKSNGYECFYIFELPFKSNFKPISEKNIYNTKDFLIKTITKNKNLQCRYSDRIKKFIQETDNFYIRWNELPDYASFKPFDSSEIFYIFEKLDSSQIYEDKFNNLCFIDINSILPVENKISFKHIKI
jgi:hypothetical protein